MAETLVTTIMRFVGLSTDQKSTTGVPAGSEWEERDTGDVYVFDGTAWGKRSPTVDVATAVLPTGGTLVALAAVNVTTTATALSAQACKAVLLQADPDNTSDIFVGDATNQPIQLLPGQSVSLPVANTNQVYHKTASGTATLNVLAIT